MEKSYSFNLKTILDNMSINGSSIRYGKQDGVDNIWKQIIGTEDQNERYKLVDLLIDKMEENAKANGFWRADEELKISFGIGTNAVHLDDRNVYYMLFDILKKLYELNQKQEEPLVDGSLFYNAIHNTIERYFGEYNGDSKLRLDLTSLDFETFKYPSVSILKGKGCAACVEKAAFAHNMWLLFGRESYYVGSTSSKFKHTNDNAHAFCIVRNKQGKLALYDQALENYGHLPDDTIDKILRGEPLVIDKPFKTYGIYANACNFGKEKCDE